MMTGASPKGRRSAPPKLAWAPLRASTGMAKAPKPLWRTLSSWYLLAEQDRMINPETQEFMARRMKATLRRLDVDHTPIATAPDRVVELLLEAGKSVSA